MGQIPSTLYGRPFDQYMSKKDECIGNSGDSYYDKLVGGVECNPVELSKTVIIKYLLSKYDPITGEGLDCIYNQRPFVGVNDDNYNAEDQLNDTTHLQMFTSYLNAICAVQDPITKIIIKTIPMGIEPFSLANEDGSVQFSIDNGITYESSVEVTGGETVYIKAAEADCGAVCGASAYDIWLAQGNTGTEQDFLDSLKGPKGDDGEDATITGIEWKGVWSANPATPYVNNNAVQSQGSSWILVDSTAGNATTDPAADTTGRWDELALAGLQGPPGNNGAFGIAGFRNLAQTTWTIVGNQFSKPVSPATNPATYTTEVGGTGANGTQSTDQGALISINTATTCTVTIPNTTTLPIAFANGTGTSLVPGVAFPNGYQVTFTQTGTGQIKFQPADTNVLILSTDNSRYTRTQYSTATLIRVNGNTWYLFGDIIPLDSSTAI